MIKILKNTSNESLLVLGVQLEPDEYYDVPVNKWTTLSRLCYDTESYIYQLITNGSITVSDGENTLNISNGINWCKILAAIDLDSIPRFANIFPFQRLIAGHIDTPRVFTYCDSIGNVNLNLGTSVIFNCVCPSSDTIAFTASSGEITSKVSGLYWIEAQITTTNTNTSRSVSKFFIQKANYSEDFQAIPNTDAYIYNRTSSAGHSTSSSRSLIELSIGDKVRVFAVRTSGSGNIYTVASASRLTIKPVDVKKYVSHFHIQAGNIENGTTWSYNKIEAGSL
jgi:hypothetical protein